MRALVIDDAAGAHAYLINPFTAEALREKLDLLGPVPRGRRDARVSPAAVGADVPVDDVPLGQAWNAVEAVWESLLGVWPAPTEPGGNRRNL